jgi:CspA family cold shock protein
VPEITLLLLFMATSFASQLIGGGSSSESESESSYSSSDRETGTVKWFNVRKGYGFITRDAGDDVFVHFRNIEGSGRRAIEEGQRVSFVVTDGDKGLQADEVSPA